MSSMNQLRLPNGMEFNLSEFLHWPMYSVIDFSGVDSFSLDAFSYVPGGNVPRSTTLATTQITANETHTNMVRKGAMNQDESIVVFSITYEIFGLTSYEDGSSPPNPIAPEPTVSGLFLRVLQQLLFVELIVGANIKKPQVEIPFAWLGQGIGADMFSSGDAAAVHVGTGGPPSPNNQNQYNIPVYIGGTGQNAAPGNSMRFKLRTSTPEGAAVGGLQQDFRIRWWLDGLRRRPG